MLLQFEFENYKSYKDLSVLNMTAINYYKEKQEQLIKSNIPGLSGYSYLRAGCIFGANASGKSNIWKALKLMRRMVLESADKTPDCLLPYYPFQFNKISKSKGTYFSVMFVSPKDHVRYEYCFTYNKKQILDEVLCSYPKGRKVTLFTRKAGNSKITVNTSSLINIPSFVKKLLNDNVLLLSLLSKYENIKSYSLIIPVFDYFKSELILLKGVDINDSFPYAGEILENDKGKNKQKNYIFQMLQHADLGIDGIRLTKIPASKVPKEINEILETLGAGEKELDEFLKRIIFEHSYNKNTLKLPLGQESDGTQQLFSLSGHLAEALVRGSTVFVDELDISLHPFLLLEIVKTFLNPKINKKNAQLLFSAHNTILLEDKLFRRDQILFVQKCDNCASRIYPLSDFNPKKEDCISLKYISGRYSAVPYIPDYFGMEN